MDAVAERVGIAKRVQRKSPWTETVVEFVKKHCALNYSAAQIAVELWTEFRMQVTRNAVIGIIHRKKLDGRPHGVRVNPPRAQRKRAAGQGNGHVPGSSVVALRARKARLTNRGSGGFTVDEIADPVPLEINDTADTEIPAAQRRTIFTLTNTTCRWPVGDPQSAEFFFCGSADGVDCDANRPYCALHSRRAYDDAGNTAAQMRWAASRATYYANR
jgi:GcrA cell cycle regulator